MMIRANSASQPVAKGKLLLIFALLGLGGMWWSALNKKAPISAATHSTKPNQQVASITTGITALAAISLPTRIEREALEPALRDPFMAYAPPAPRSPKPSPLSKLPRRCLSSTRRPLPWPRHRRRL
jgi:hypothetical protein